MKQLTLATTGVERYAKTTRRAAFLAEMERVVPWSALWALIAKSCMMHHASASRGWPVSSQRHRKETGSFTFPPGGPLCTSGEKGSQNSRNAAAASPASRSPNARCHRCTIDGEPRHQKGAGRVGIAFLIAEVRAGVHRPRIVRVLREGSIDLWPGGITLPILRERHTVMGCDRPQRLVERVTAEWVVDDIGPFATGQYRAPSKAVRTGRPGVTDGAPGTTFWTDHQLGARAVG